MAKYLSGDEVDSKLSQIIGMLTALKRQRREIEKKAETMEDSGETASAVATTINGLLTDWGSLRDEVVTNLSAIPVLYQSRVKIGMPERYTKAAIYATNKSYLNSYGEACAIIRVGDHSAESAINPFAFFQSGDIVSVSSAENSGNNCVGASVVYTPESSNNAPLTYTGALWTAGTNWTVTGSTIANFQAVGAAVSTGTKFNLSKVNMSGAWTNGDVYLVEFTLSGVSAGSVSVGTNTAAYYTATSNGTHYALVTADNHSDGLVFKSADAIAFSGTVSSVYCVAFNGLLLSRPLTTDNDADTSLVITLQER